MVRRAGCALERRLISDSNLSRLELLRPLHAMPLAAKFGAQGEKGEETHHLRRDRSRRLDVAPLKENESRQLQPSTNQLSLTLQPAQLDGRSCQTELPCPCPVPLFPTVPQAAQQRTSFSAEYCQIP